MTIQDKREELRQRVEASRGRFSPDPVEQADPVLVDRVEDFARQYPLALMGGALLIGMLLGLSGRRSGDAPKGITNIDKKISKLFVDLLFAIGIGLLEDVSKSKVFNEDEEDEARASSAATKNKMIRDAAGVAAEAGQKLRDSNRANAE